MISKLVLLGKTHAILTIIAFLSASVSGLALLLHAAGWLPLYFLVDVLGAPSLILLLALGAVAQRINQSVFLNRLVTGAWGGLIATLVYDVTRLFLWQADIFKFNPFISHPIFGWMITGQPEETIVAQSVGWTYHFWNGVGFGIMYTMIAGPAHWVYAILWALFLEICWLTALPSVLQLRPNPELVAMSLIGHAGYGVALGLIARKYCRA